MLQIISILCAVFCKSVQWRFYGWGGGGLGGAEAPPPSFMLSPPQFKKNGLAPR